MNPAVMNTPQTSEPKRSSHIEGQRVRPAQLRRVPKPPYIIWYQCPFPEVLRHCNLDASVGNHEWAVANHQRGIASLMWVYGPNLYHEAKDWETRRFVDYYASYAEQGYAGIAMDEWNVGDEHPYVPMISAALREVKARYPRFFVAVWVTHPTPQFRQLVKEGAVDLAIIQGYSFVPNHPEWAIGSAGVRERVELMRTDRLLRKTVVCVGMVAPTPDKYGHKMTAESLTQQVTELARRYPAMPGVAFYGVLKFGEYQAEPSATKELIQVADALAGRLYRR